MADVDLAPAEVPVLDATADLWRASPADQFRHSLDLVLDGIEANVARR